jgi:PAS domain S-box-containing protein
MHDPEAPDPSWPTSSLGDASALTSFLGSLPATVWTTDQQLVLTFVQGVYLRRLQIDPGRLIGRTIQDILLDGREDHPLIQGHLTALAGHETTVRVEWGGRLFNVRLAPLRDPDGRIAGCVGVNLEVGWLPDDDGTLRESDVRLQRVIDSNILGIAFGDDEGRITDANDAFLQLAGYNRDELADDSVSWPALLPVEAHQRQIHALDEILATGRCAPFETEIVRKDGRRVPVLVGAARLSAQRREGVAFVLDITDRKRTVGGLRAELACADHLADAPTPADAEARLLRVFTTALSWRSAALWTVTPEGSRLVARDGASAEDAVDFQPLAEKVLATQIECRSAGDEALALPLLTDGRCYGALILAGWVNGAPETDLIETCRRIAGRLGRFLARRQGCH